jgi:phage-related protein
METILSFSAGFRENVGTLVDNAIELIMTLADGIIKALPDLIAIVPEIISNFANAINDNAPKLLKSAAELIAKLVKGLIDNIPVIIQNIPEIIKAIVDTILAFNWLNLGGKIIEFFAQGIKGMLSSIVNVAKDIIKSITDGGGLKNLPQMALQWGKDLISNFVSGIKSTVGKVGDAVFGVADKIASFLHFSEPDEGPLSNFHTYGPDMVELSNRVIGKLRGMTDEEFEELELAEAD